MPGMLQRDASQVKDTNATENLGSLLQYGQFQNYDGRLEQLVNRIAARIPVACWGTRNAQSYSYSRRVVRGNVTLST